MQKHPLHDILDPETEHPTFKQIAMVLVMKQIDSDDNLIQMQTTAEKTLTTDHALTFQVPSQHVSSVT